mmetsp:Transcript_20105/g.63225  ORF Transcript_20105/g.63225 Transcript_20105/m.63225 type:complete len:248 (-) Transcript_20105:868-1611(-)
MEGTAAFLLAVVLGVSPAGSSGRGLCGGASPSEETEEVERAGAAGLAPFGAGTGSSASAAARRRRALRQKRTCWGPLRSKRSRLSKRLRLSTPNSSRQTARKVDMFSSIMNGSLDWVWIFLARSALGLRREASWQRTVPSWSQAQRSSWASGRASRPRTSRIHRSASGSPHSQSSDARSALPFDERRWRCWAGAAALIDRARDPARGPGSSHVVRARFSEGRCAPLVAQTPSLVRSVVVSVCRTEAA